MHRGFNLAASIVLFIVGILSISIFLFGVFYGWAYEDKDLKWLGVCMQVMGILITLTFVIGGWRQFQKVLEEMGM